MPSKIRAIDIRRIHKGRFLSYYEIDYLNLDGELKTYEMVSKNHDLTINTIGRTEQAVVLIIFNKDHSKMLLSKEFRLGVNQFVYNPVAGMIDSGETPLEAARRETYEETGLMVTNVIDVLPPAFTCAPVTDDLCSVFVCEAVGDIRPSDSPNEEIYAEWMSKEDVSKILFSTGIAWSGRMQAFCYQWIKE